MLKLSFVALLPVGLQSLAMMRQAYDRLLPAMLCVWWHLQKETLRCCVGFAFEQVMKAVGC